MNHSLTASSPVSKRLSPRKMAFITGTLLLTSTGFICRILGFFYRIFMSRTIGAEGLGIYNMVHPIFSICFAVCAGSIQTALSQYVAANQTRGRAVFRTGLVIAMGMSFLLAWVIYGNAGFLAEKLLLEPRCAPYLPVMAVSVPFAALHACINGYYYGMQKARVPAFSQVAEQVIRMGAVFLIASIWLESGRQITVSLAVYGHLIGEMASAVFTVFCLGFFPPCKDGDSRRAPAIPLSFGATAAPLMALALPLMGNRLILNVLGSAEAIWIPNKLMSSGLTNSEALSVYGVLTSMALPFILFPSAITNSIAVLLLPSVAKDQAEGRTESISGSVSMALRYSLYMGILCIGIFVLFGCPLGISVFKEEQAGHCMQILAWLCPFLYLAATMGSILNGLGCTRTTFLQSVAAMLLRLVFVVAGIPLFGIYGYLCGMLISEIFLALAHLWSLKRRIPFTWNARDMIAKPAFFLFLATGIHYFIAGFLPTPSGTMPLFLKTSGQILLLSSCYGVLLLYAHILRK